jgi:hypothetical protein
MMRKLRTCNVHVMMLWKILKVIIALLTPEQVDLGLITMLRDA